ncbi:tRNA 2-selenouridine(34) synthase MnmH [Pseudooceanicola sp. LIPI14-2-Ac024]|uniref:tRNA 2-selenouridine(34) synthase MnmH n=1 Tax=Pseudooceanicola sp. LIPI14-2-Ac024 TaxID=3344875 RepID=UPI0035D02EFC
MPVILNAISDLRAQDFDEIIDVRAPSEFADDHLPGALSLPVLDDAERARVGTIYKQVSPFDARKIGAALVARNAAKHIEGPLADRPGGWHPLVYCWRGGQRSGSFATILGQIGWRVETLQGGYKAWRKLVLSAVTEGAFPCPVILLDGNTGSAKTEVLNLLPARGVQVIDLEGLAQHRGSLFGATGPQPGQRQFECRLAMAIDALDPARPVVVEAESAKIGDCRIPPRLWHAMHRAPRIEVAAPRAERAAYLTRAYADMTADPARLATTIDALRAFHAQADIEAWQAMAATGAFTSLAQALMQAHYDPRYEKHRRRVEVPVTPLAVDSLSPAALPGIADRLAEMIRTR